MVTQLFTGRQCTWTALLLDACEVLIFLQENAYILKYIYIYIKIWRVYGYLVSFFIFLPFVIGCIRRSRNVLGIVFPLMCPKEEGK